MLNIEDTFYDKDFWISLLVDDFDSALKNSASNPILNLPAFFRQILKPRIIISMVNAIKNFLSYLKTFRDGPGKLNFDSTAAFYESLFVENDPSKFVDKFIADMVFIAQVSSSNCNQQTSGYH